MIMQFLQLMLIGEGNKETSTSDPVGGPPLPPQNLQATLGDGYVYLTWDIPADDGGSNITLYTLRRSGAVIKYIDPNIHSYNDTTFGNSNSYAYTISARNSFGEGSINAILVSPGRSPDAPQNLQVTSGDNYVYMTWEAPAFDGGNSPITSYTIYRNNTAITTVNANILFYNDTGLTRGASFYYAVSAHNAIGEGSKVTSNIVYLGSSPSAPENLQATSGDTYVYLTWDIPADNGGYIITEYRVYRNGSLIYTVQNQDPRSYNDTFAANIGSYSYFVRAVNFLGESAKSNVVNAGPSTVPDAPQNLQVTSGDNYVYITWDAPAFDGNSPITSYTIYRNNTVIGTTVDGNILSYNDTAENGLVYNYTVVANNIRGEGALSNSETANPFGPLLAPREFFGDPGDTYVYLTWQ